MSRHDPIGWLSLPRRGRPLVALVLALTACPSPEPAVRGPEGPPGAQGDPGPTGPTGGDGTAWLADATTLERGSPECAYGGVRYDVGLDDGSNGGVANDLVLQGGEVDHSDLVCYPAGSFAGFEPPSGPAGTAVIDTSGGDALNQGGYGGEIFAVLSGTGGHITAWPTGHANTDFVAPTSDHAYLGIEPLIITAGQTLTPRIIDPTAQATLVNGDVFQFNDVGIFEQKLWVRRSGNNFQVTGLRIEAGGTLVVPRDVQAGRALLAVTEDIVNAGTITSATAGSEHYDLRLGARHYFGEATSRIDVAGLPGNATVSGGYSANLVLIASPISENLINGMQSGGSTTCPSMSPPSGSIVNRGVLDLSAGALGSLEPDAARDAGTGLLCAGDTLYNLGAWVGHGVGYGGEGGRYDATAMVGLHHGGAIDVTGGRGPTGTGDGGSVRFSGKRVTVGGSINASAFGVPSSANCATSCSGGDGGSLTVIAYDLGMSLSGDIDLHGGDAVGHNGDNGSGGNGGFMDLSTGLGPVILLDGLSPNGPIDISSDISLRGGAGSGKGGNGGDLSARIEYDGTVGPPSGQGISFLGYSQLVSNGGHGYHGGYGGFMFLAGGEGLGGPRAVITQAQVGGSAALFVPYVARGGEGIDWNHGLGAISGGGGGIAQVMSRMSVPGSNAQAIISAPVDVSGGSGTAGGRGGFAVTYGAAYSAIHAPITAHGGAGSPTDESDGYGGEGGGAGAFSQYMSAAMKANADVTGGAGFYGGEGGQSVVSGPEVDVAGNVLANGGTGGATGAGLGGKGGRVEVWSSDTWSVITGTVSVNGAAGATPGAQGTLRVDGFVLP